MIQRKHAEFAKIVGPDRQISLGPPFERLAPVPLTNCSFREKNVRCGMLDISNIIGLVPDVLRLNFSIVNDQLDTSKNKI
jgi:hypothetical protein